MVTCKDHLILSEAGSDDVIEMYLNTSNEIFVHNQEIDARGWFFVITKSDWEQIKEFIDYQFS